MPSFTTRMRQAFRRTDTTRTGAESLAATDTPTTADSSAETAEGTPAVHERRVSDTGAAETAAYTEAADRTADRLQNAFYREMTLANTPLSYQHPDAGHAEDTYGPDHSEDAYQLLRAHLRDHPELRTHPKWAHEYTALDAETTRPNTAEADAEADDRGGWHASQDTHEEDLRDDAEVENRSWLAQQEVPGDEIDLGGQDPDVWESAADIEAAAASEAQDFPPDHPDYIGEPEYYPPGHPDHRFASQEAEDRFWDTWESRQDARATRESEDANRSADAENVAWLAQVNDEASRAANHPWIQNLASVTGQDSDELGDDHPAFDQESRPYVLDTRWDAEYAADEDTL